MLLLLHAASPRRRERRQGRALQEQSKDSLGSTSNWAKRAFEFAVQIPALILSAVWLLCGRLLNYAVVFGAIAVVPFMAFCLMVALSGTICFVGSFLDLVL